MANYFLSSAHRYHPCADSGGRRRTHTASEACAVSRPLFSHCGLTMQPPKSYSVGGQRSSRAAYRQARRRPANPQESLVHGEIYTDCLAHAWYCRKGAAASWICLSVMAVTRRASPSKMKQASWRKLCCWTEHSRRRTSTTTN
ncbi:UNVERIFIED_CONTAM: hypothetical protein FKN15_063778 [Acipenser sinensis]